ncbi:MAG: TlpA family protein disulfide reductase [Clostridium sp.]|uniref:TlpA family protein disulfide reductase n=1 Tax=Clostridium sp. TaxID=1506 RepID=UPI003D6D687B
MKKSSKMLIGITIACVALVGVSIYTIKNYNNAKDKAAAENSLQNSNVENNMIKEPSVIKPNVIKTKAPDFKLKDLDGKELTLSDLKGKKVFLNFWATWCPPCKSEMPEIQKLYEETKDTDLVIVAVDIGEPLSEVKSFTSENKYTFKVLLDSDQSVAAKYEISSIPTSYFIDEDGNIISKFIGAMNIDKMKSYIKNLDK